MTQEEKEALAKFAESTDVSIRGLIAAIEAAASEIQDLRRRVLTLEGLRYFDIVEREERGNEENDNSCEPTQDKVEQQERD